MKRYLLACALALVAAWAQAGVGLVQLPATAEDGIVTVFYPTAAHDQPLQRGPFRLQLAEGAAPVRGNGRLVMISHGSGANPWVNADLARALVQAGYVVALPEHRGDNTRDPSKPGPDSWKLRPAEVSRAIDAVLRDARFGPLVAADKVGVYGFSAGGHTALTLAGGRWSPARFKAHCDAHIAEDFATCVGLFTQLTGGMMDGLKRTVALSVIRLRFDDEQIQQHTDPRVRAIIAGAPHASTFDLASLAQPGVPLGLVRLGEDKWLVPRFHSDPVLKACQPRCELVADLPAAGHGALLSPPPPAEALGKVARDLIGDPQGFDRAVLPQVERRIVAFFDKHLR